MTAPATPRRRIALRQWRNWSLPVKFAAVVLVPVIFAVGLGISQIRWQVEQANEYERVTHVLDSAQRVEPLVAALQNERNAAVLTDNSAELDRQVDAVNKAFAGVDEELGHSGNGTVDFGQVVEDRHNEVHAALGKLNGAREAVRRESLSTPDTINAYTMAITTVLSLDRALTSTVSEPTLASTASALQDMLSMMEEVRLQQSWVLSGLSQGQLAPQSVDALQGSRARLISKIADARATVARHWQERLDQTTQGPEIVQRNAMLTQILMAGMGGAPFPASPEQWNGISDQVVVLIDDGHNDLAEEVRAGASTLREDAGNAAGWDSALLLASLLVAAAVITTITRQLLGSLRTLRHGALDAAQHELPEAVAGIRAGEEVGELPPLPVQTTEEVGQVARAFDEVQRQALRLAAEQASLRLGYSESFVGVSRRSQGLLERQLRLFEQLEQDEEDPDQLSRLFQLDHLATRMRRNNENLMVLSGSDLARRFVRPTEAGDMLRAAVSEIEQYPRVIVQPPPQVRLLGHAASDLVRLMAELMDNAANFSAPDTSVTVSSYQAGDGSITIDVLDEGIGMGDQELAAANERLSRVDENDLATSRRMGLFVVARLALRHGVNVRLHGGPDVDGVRATVVVPAEHVVAAAPAATPTPAMGGQRNGVAHHELPTSGSFGTGPHAVEAYSDSAGHQSDDTGFVWSTGGGESGFSTGETGFSSAETGFSSAETGFSTAEPADPGGQNTFNTGFLKAGSGSLASSPLPKREPTAGLVGPSQSGESSTSGEPAGSLFMPAEIPEQAEDSYDFSADWTSSDLAWPPAIEDTPPSEASDDAPSPIFEEVSTQWFQPIEGDEEPSVGPAAGGQEWPGDEQATSIMDSGSWSFTADSAEEAEAAAAEDGSGFTESGLPRRETRGRPAVHVDENDPLGIGDLDQDGRGEADSADGPGSIDSGAGVPADRSPQELSRRLADLQGGLRFGRKGPMTSSQDSAGPDPSTADPSTTGELDGTAEQELPRRGGSSGWIAESANNGDSAPATNGNGNGNGGWNFATDESWKQVEAATSSNPTSFTESGLPRRTPNAQLAPGSAGSGSSRPEGQPFERDASALRGRLSSFQSGVERGRHRLPDES